MIEEDYDVLEVFLIHPTSISEEDLRQIESKAIKEFIRGDMSFARCLIVEYIEYLNVEGLRARSH